MVIGEVKAACSGNSVELMVGECILEMTAGCGQGVIENVIRVIHLIYAVNSLETAFVKTGIVGHKRISLQQRDYFFPNVWKDRCAICIFRAQAMNLTAEPMVVLRLRVDETVKGVHYNIIAHHDNTNAANAGWLLVGSLKIQPVE